MVLSGFVILYIRDRVEWVFCQKESDRVRFLSPRGIENLAGMT